MISNSALRARCTSIFLWLLVFFCAQDLHAQEKARFFRFTAELIVLRPPLFPASQWKP
jgi:hypothetical protein